MRRLEWAIETTYFSEQPMRKPHDSPAKRMVKSA